MDLPIEIVQQAGNPPFLPILPEFYGVEAHGRLDREHVLDQVFVFNIFVYQGKSFVAIQFASTIQGTRNACMEFSWKDRFLVTQYRNGMIDINIP